VSEINAVKLYRLGSRVQKIEASLNQKNLAGQKDTTTDDKSKNRREWFKIAISFFSVVAVLVGAFIQVQNFLYIKEQEFHFNLSQEIIELSKQLNDENPQIVRDAIFLLATVGPDAAPLLIYHLDNTDTTPEVVSAITTALKEIALNSSDRGREITKERIIDSLSVRTLEILNREFHVKEAPSIKSISRHLSAVTGVYSLLGCPHDSRTAMRDQISNYIVEAQELEEDEGKKTLLKNLEQAESDVYC